MRIETIVVVDDKETEKRLAAECDSDVITFYLDGKEIFRLDFEGNFTEFVVAIMKVWGGWNQTDKISQVQPKGVTLSTCGVDSKKE